MKVFTMPSAAGSEKLFSFLFSISHSLHPHRFVSFFFWSTVLKRETHSRAKGKRAFNSYREASRVGTFGDRDEKINENNVICSKKREKNAFLYRFFNSKFKQENALDFNDKDKCASRCACQISECGQNLFFLCNRGFSSPPSVLS